jgi:hypothetical protein
VQHELLERAAALGHDEEPASLAPGDERFLDRTPAGNDLVVPFDEAGFGRFEPRAIECGRRRVGGSPPLDPRSFRPGPEGALAPRPAGIGSEWPVERWAWPRRLERRFIAPRAGAIVESGLPSRRRTFEALTGAVEPTARPLVPKCRPVRSTTLVAAGWLVARRTLAWILGAILPARRTVLAATEAKPAALGPWPIGAWSGKAWPVALGTTRPGPATGPVSARSLVASPPAWTIRGSAGGRPIE